MQEIGYDLAELSRTKYVQVAYTGVDDMLHEIKADVNILSEGTISLYFRNKTDFDIMFPQQVTVSFITDGGLFIANTVLQEVSKSDKYIYLTILPPEIMMKRQERKYFRIQLKRACVLVATNEDGHSTSFMSRLVDISAGGVLIHQLESMFNSDIIAINPDDYSQFNIVIFLDIDTVLKLSARFVRQEETEKASRYAFEFTNMKRNDIDTISKYVAKEQLEQLKEQRKNEEIYSA